MLDAVLDCPRPGSCDNPRVVTTDDNLLAALGAFLARESDMRLGLVFGSVASGLAKKDSDLDVAVLAHRPLDAGRKSDLIEELARIAGRPVDLIDLANAGVHIARSVLLDGKVVFAADAEVYPDQITRMLLDSADFLPYRTRILKERREAWLARY